MLPSSLRSSTYMAGALPSLKSSTYMAGTLPKIVSYLRIVYDIFTKISTLYSLIIAFYNVSSISFNFPHTQIRSNLHPSFSEPFQLNALNFSGSVLSMFSTVPYKCLFQEK